jgi:Carbohydrate binding domain
MLVMRAFLPLLWLVLAPSVLAQEAAIDVDQFRLETILGAQSKASLGTNAPNGQKSVEVVVSKPGLEFWSVELRAAGQKFEPGKTYEIKFEAKASPAQFIYVVPEKVNGNQASVAEGTTLRIPEDWTECTVVVSKPGLEFWSVELRAAGQKFEPGKTYEIKFEAKASPAQFKRIVFPGFRLLVAFDTCSCSQLRNALRRRQEQEKQPGPLWLNNDEYLLDI